jgi:hypothetical protein
VTELTWSQVQSENGLCVPTSVAMVVSEFFGDPGDQHYEMEVAGAAVGMDLLTANPDGTWSGMTAEGAVSLLDHYNIPAHIEPPEGHVAVPQEMIERLDQYADENRGILVAVDSGELPHWGGSSDDATTGDAGPDHALVVTDIEIDPLHPEGGTVTLNDPGHPEGAQVAMGVDEFRDAWNDSNFQMVVTDYAPPAPEAPSGPADLPATEAKEPGASHSVEGGVPRAGGFLTNNGKWFSGGLVILPIVLGRAIARRLDR